MKRLIAILLAVCISMFVVSTVKAQITFDEFPLGTLVDDEYADQGVIFHTGDVTPGLPIISNNGAMPDQPILRPQGEAGGLYIYQGDFYMEFPNPVIEVDFDSGYWDSIGSALIEVYDPDINLLATLSNTGTGVEAINVSGLGAIGSIYFNSVADPAGGDIDNLAFQTALGVEKVLDSAVNPAGELLDPNDLPMYTDIVFTLIITVTNNADDPITDIVVKDHFGADLEIEGVTAITQGSWSMSTSNAKKSPQERLEWNVGTLGAGNSASLTIQVSTDINPGNSSLKNSKPGKQEYTSPGEHTLNSGANAKGMLGEWEVCGTSNSIVVNVAEED